MEDIRQHFSMSRIVNSTDTKDKGSYGCGRVNGGISSLYPTADTPHEIAKKAIGMDDRDTIRRLSSTHLYLPIRWDAFVSVSSGPILNILLNQKVLSPQCRLEAAYRLGDKVLISEYVSALDISPSEKAILDVKYGYTPETSAMDLYTQIQYLPSERILPLLSLSNYILSLGYALELGRTDIIDTILVQYTGTSSTVRLLSLTPQYEQVKKGNYSSVPRETMEYLTRMGYISVSQSIHAIVSDDVSLLTSSDIQNEIPSPTIPSLSEIALMFQYDSVNVWRYYRESLSLSSLSSILHTVRGQIRREILLSLSGSDKEDLVIQALLKSSTSDEMDEILNLRRSLSPNGVTIQILTTAASEGYIEILDKYLPSIPPERNIIYVFRILSHVSIYPDSGDNNMYILSLFLNYKYEGTQLDCLGEYLIAILYNKDNVSVPSYIYEGFLGSAVVNGNIHFIRKILSQYTISSDLQKKIQSLIRQYHSLNPTLYRSLMSMFTS